MNHPNCLPDEVLRAYHDGAALPAVASSVAAHLSECPTCLTRLESFDTKTDSLIVALRRQRVVPQSKRDPLLEHAMANVLAEATGAAAPPELVPGSMLDEYRIVEKLGAGGMGTVYRAVHMRLDKEVALKVIQPRWRRDAHMLERFQRELRAIGKLKHPHIVQATDAGEAAGVLYLAMELERGTDLHEYVSHHGPLPVGEACEYIRQAALGLACAHAAGMVHRDVKPSNLLRTAGGQIKLLDLGLARLQADETPPSESTGAAGDESATDFELACTLGPMGTDDYMAPEQWEDAHRVDQRTDLYGLGCTLVFLLTGQPPFPAPAHVTRAQKREAHLKVKPPSLRQRRPDVPAKLDAFVQRLLAKSPDARPVSAAAVADALAQIARRRKHWRWLTATGSLIAAAALVAAVVVPALRRPQEDRQAVVVQPQPVVNKETPTVVDSGPPPGKIPMSEEEARALQKRWAAHLGREVVQKNSLGMRFALVPPGKFPAWTATTVVISRPYEIGVTEVTRAQFREFVLDRGHRTEAETNGLGGYVYFPSQGRPRVKRSVDFVWWTPGYPNPADDDPVVHVTWQDAVAFCEWLSLRENRNYFLPTAAEWQWACRAGIATNHGSRDPSKNLGDYAWYAANSSGRVQPVGKKLPNPWGLYDMVGNVQEFCRDGPGSWPMGEVVDPLMPLALRTRYVIGGHHSAMDSDQEDQTPLNWKFGAGQVPQEANTITGFRVVRMK